MNLARPVLRLLETEKLCFLATSYREQPHICLMNFTYRAEENLIILTSRTDTTKVQHIKENPAVALLVYSLGSDEEGPVSCTLHGTATLYPPGEDHFYRDIHHKRHDHMSQFIIGDTITVITVRLQVATLSDVNDTVHTYSLPPSE